MMRIMMMTKLTKLNLNYERIKDVQKQELSEVLV